MLYAYGNNLKSESKIIISLFFRLASLGLLIFNLNIIRQVVSVAMITEWLSHFYRYGNRPTELLKSHAFCWCPIVLVT